MKGFSNKSSLRCFYSLWLVTGTFCFSILLSLYDNIQSGHTHLRILTFGHSILDGQDLTGTFSLVHSWHILYEMFVAMAFRFSLMISPVSLFFANNFVFSFFISLYGLAMWIYLIKLGFGKFETLLFSVLPILIFPGLTYEFFLTEDNVSMYFMLILLPVALSEDTQSGLKKKILSGALLYGVGLIIHLQGIIFLGLLFMAIYYYLSKDFERIKLLLGTLLGGLGIYITLLYVIDHLFLYNNHPIKLMYHEIKNFRIGFGNAGDSYGHSRISFQYLSDIFYGLGQFLGGYSNHINIITNGERYLNFGISSLIILPFACLMSAAFYFVRRLELYRQVKVKIVLGMLLMALAFCTSWETFFHHRWDMFGLLCFLLVASVYKESRIFRQYFFYPFITIQLVWGLNEGFHAPLTNKDRASFNEFKTWLSERNEIATSKGALLRGAFIKFDNYTRSKYLNLESSTGYVVQKNGRWRILFPKESYISYDWFTNVDNLDESHFISREAFETKYSNIYVDPEVANLR